jgi:hypothetical protein
MGSGCARDRSATAPHTRSTRRRTARSGHAPTATAGPGSSAVTGDKRASVSLKRASASGLPSAVSDRFKNASSGFRASRPSQTARGRSSAVGTALAAPLGTACAFVPADAERLSGSGCVSRDAPRCQMRSRCTCRSSGRNSTRDVQSRCSRLSRAGSPASDHTSLGSAEHQQPHHRRRAADSLLGMRPHRPHGLRAT